MSSTSSRASMQATTARRWAGLIGLGPGYAAVCSDAFRAYCLLLFRQSSIDMLISVLPALTSPGFYLHHGRETRYAWPMIGTSPLRKEDRRLLVGAGRFVDDLTRPGLLHLGVVRSREAHARVVGVATRAALAAPGVVAVWTGADLAGVAPAIPAAYGGSHKSRPFAQQILAREIVRYVGEAVA